MHCDTHPSRRKFLACFAGAACAPRLMFPDAAFAGQRIRITKVSTKIVSVRVKNFVFVKIETDAGVTGWGEASVEFKPFSVAGAVKDLSSFVIGEDPRRIEHIYQSAYRQSFFPMGIIGMSALSGIEQACWDILGKSLNTPVHVLLGGAVRNKIRLYSNIGTAPTAEELVDRGHKSIADGYAAIKTVLIPLTQTLPRADQLRRVEATMKALREAMGDDVDILLDFHGRTTPAAAIQYIHVLEPYRPYFVEEPALSQNVDAIRQVSNATRIPIATGERLVSRFEFRELCEKRAAAIIQPDISHCGGI